MASSRREIPTYADVAAADSFAVDVAAAPVTACVPSGQPLMLPGAAVRTLVAVNGAVSVCRSTGGIVRKRALHVALGGLLVAAFIGVASRPASAATWEHDVAVKGNPTGSAVCAHRAGVEACFKADGDVWWVGDTAKDGYSAEARWEEWLPLGGGDSVLNRNGACVNSLGSPNWGKCDKDYQENGELWFRGCVIDASKGELKACTDWMCVRADGSHTCVSLP